MSPPSEQIKECIFHLFALFFVTKPTHATMLQVKAVLYNQFEKSSSKMLLMDYLSNIFVHLHLMDKKLLSIADHSVQASHLNFKISTNYNCVNSKIKFFEQLCLDFENGNNKLYDENFLRESMIKLVMFNNVKRPGVASRMSFFEDLSQWLKEMQCILMVQEDSKSCSCYEYLKSGDCHCMEDDYQCTATSLYGKTIWKQPVGESGRDEIGERRRDEIDS